MAKNASSTIIIKRIKKGGHGAHHGGAWKVAYADFVTAMMAFFLLLWLLNVTTDVQKRGIADYFDANITWSQNYTGGANGLLGGRALGPPGTQTQNQSTALVLPLPQMRPEQEGEDGKDTEVPGKDH